MSELNEPEARDSTCDAYTRVELDEMHEKADRRAHRVEAVRDFTAWLAAHGACVHLMHHGGHGACSNAMTAEILAKLTSAWVNEA